MGVELAVVPNNLHVDDSLSSCRHGIVRALAAASKHETADYEKLILDLRDLRIDDPASDKFLQLRLRAMSQAVSFINERDHEILLSHVLGMSLWMHGLEVADALTEFVINLATANGRCVVQCLDMLVRNFLPPSCGLPVFIDFFSRRALMKGMPKEMLVQQKAAHMERKEAVLNRLHFAIGRIAELVPMTAFRLQPVILQRMPHRIVDKEWNALYLENMLRLEQSSAEDFIQKQMLMAVVDRLIEIDVEIRWEDIVREEDSNKVFVFDMELDETSEENETGSIDPTGRFSNLDGERKQTLGAVADKMDILMDMTLQHLQVCADEGRNGQVFDVLMKSFQSTILDTYKSKFTQFLIFHVCSLAPTTCGAKFAALLCDTLISTERAPNTRMCAAAYLASYLARAKYLPLAVISSSLERIVGWCVKYAPRQNEKKGGLAVDGGVSGVFFSACQAVMYILCFRMKKLMDDSEQHTVLSSLPIEQLLRHNLNPLKLCLPSIVEEFLKQAKAAQLVDSRLLSEINMAVELLPSSTFGGINRLDMFFPFDPYLLKQSDRFIRPNFIFWSMVHSQDEEEVSDVEFEGNDNGVDDSFNERDLSPHRNMRRFLKENQRSREWVASRKADGETGEEHGVFSEDDIDIDAFELSMNRMSLTPGDVAMPVLRPLKPPAKLLPLPAKLSIENPFQYSRALL